MNYGDYFTDEAFWNKVKRYAKRAGRRVLEPALVLYFCMRDDDTPAWAKGVILGALGYFIFPMDAIPDATPAVGFADDLGALAWISTARNSPNIGPGPHPTRSSGATTGSTKAP
jgi:uncharacterized membrane protein YkvA (DUF1232 family)